MGIGLWLHDVKCATAVVAQDGSGDFNGTDETPIQNAINYVYEQGGGIVFVKRGTYTCSTTITAKSNVRLISEGATLKKGADIVLIKIVNVNDFWLEGFILDGNKIDGNPIVYCENAHRTKILRNKFINPPSDAFMLTFQQVASDYCEVIGNYFDGSGVTGQDSFAGLPHKSIIAYNYIKDSPWSGITAGVMEDVVIIGNVIDNPNKSGISIDSGTSPSYRVTIANNIILNPGAVGINVGWSKNVPVYDIIITGNIVKNAGSSGIVAVYGRNIQIIGNRIENVGSNGIGTRGIDNLVISDNVIINPNANNNDEYRNSSGITHFSDEITGYAADRRNFVIESNIILDERDTNLMKLGICLSYAPDVPSYQYDGIIRNNIIKGSTEEAIARVNEQYQTKNWNFDDYNITVKGNYGWVTENSGTAVFIGDGTTTSFNIAHGLARTPKYWSVEEASSAAGAAEISYATANSSSITVNFKSTPASSSTVIVSWYAEV